MVRYGLTVRHHFDACHRLPKHPSKCSEWHGHRWEVEVNIAVDAFPKDIMDPEKNGMIIDFGAIKEIINELDHGNLNNQFANPTAEVIATWLLQDISCKFALYGDVIVTVWESPNCSVSATGWYPSYEIAGGCMSEGTDA